MTLSYADAPVQVRDDLPAAHIEFFDKLARPGNWWTGGERVAIAQEVRRAWDCALCAERKAALSPFSVDGSHDCGDALPEVAIDAIHRIVTDPSRLTRTYLEKCHASGLPDGHYVELLGVVVAMVSIDQFATGLGIAPRPLPAPLPGEPTKMRPENLEHETAWVPMIQNGKASGPDAELFGGAKRSGNVIRAMSLVPDAVRSLLSLSAAHYMAPEDMMDFDAGRTLDRRQIELIAGRVSALRDCFY